MADILEVEPTIVARPVDRPLARGPVERRHDPDDRCVGRLHPTPAAVSRSTASMSTPTS
ncbi:MAG: winged helix-turn-helix transcriptional regulator [Alphaproteobacteria bacterium]|nr:winged helix-turn-helix transcriptional regulator [Alphaproteobacteria bacterium]